jgi:DNA-binding CsgD family transcriptional regulator
MRPHLQADDVLGDAMNVQAWPLPVERPLNYPSISALDDSPREQSWLMGVLEILIGDTNGLDAIRHAAVAIDHFGFVLDVNPSAEAMFDDSFYVRKRRLTISDPQSRNSLDALIRQLIAIPAVDAIPDMHPIVIRRGGKRPIIAKVLAVPAAARNLFLGARAIFNLVPVEPKARPDALLLSEAFGLTSAEARLAAALSDGTSLNAAAEELNISRLTARSQLKTVFAKTDTHRQSQLVALVSRL